MKKSDIINKIGRNLYYSESALSQLTALVADYGNINDPPVLIISIGVNDLITDLHEDIYIPGFIEDIVWDSNIPNREKIDLSFSIYDDIPEYGLMQSIAYHFQQFSHSDRIYVLDKIKKRLEENNPILARPIAYALAVDFFEYNLTVEEVWTTLTSGDVSSTVIQTILNNSGPVPWNLKLRLYGQLLSNDQWHPYILRSLRVSTFELLGDIDPRSALQVLHQLKLTENTSDITEIEQKLVLLGGRQK